MTLATIFYVLHVLSAVVWIGGMAFAILVLRPSLALVPPPARLQLMGAVHRRFFLLVWHAMPALILTGYAMLFGWFGGFRGAGWHIHVMHLTGLIMAVLFIVIFFGPWKRMRAALATEAWPEAAAATDRIRQLVSINPILGVLTAGVAAWGRFGG